DKRYGSLANYWFQPLTHLSKTEVKSSNFQLLSLATMFFSKESSSVLKKIVFAKFAENQICYNERSIYRFRRQNPYGVI
ncbi:MAG: hypothetical protein RIC15_09060, partial [Vicingaceae bacterium]